MTVYQYPDYLAHHGVKGMKWGMRRYQNSDGTLTAAGKAHQKQLDTFGKETGNIVKQSNSIVKNSEQVARKTTSKVSARDRELVKSMSDEELRSAVNRANLEAQYLATVSKSSTSRGRETVADVLAYAGTALAITGSALSIAVSIKKLL
jgi:hypothetical protein